MNFYLILPILTQLFKLCYAWQFPHVILDFFPARSRIPQFIRDTRHPWLKENGPWLERLKDPEHALCSLDSDLRPGHSGTPADLLKRLEINNNRWGVDRAGWRNAATRMKEMTRCPAAMNDVETLEIEIWIHLDINNGHENPLKGILLKESPDPGPTLPNSFIELLASMPNLRSLQWETFGHGNDIFRKAFLDANVTLPSVNHLRPAHDMDVLVRLCPNLEKLEASHHTTKISNSDTDARLNLIESARNKKNLKQFSMDAGWSLQFLEATFQTIPNITTLEIDGAPRESPYSYSPFSKTEGNILSTYIDVLTLFPRLRHLILPSVDQFDLGFDGGPWCGNAYDGPEGRAYGRYVMEDYAKATEMAVGIVLPRLSNLETLSFGATTANLTRNDDGQLNATWPWTGRMTEWTYEIWSE